jgi:hypothetical protein
LTYNIVKSCKTKDHPNGNAATAWEKLKHKYEPVSAPTLLKLDEKFRELSLKTWIMEIEDLQVRIETMHSIISENQFMIHILNIVTSDYELQLAMMERSVRDIERPLSVEEVRGRLRLYFERLNVSKAEGEVLEEHGLFGGQFKRKCQNCGHLSHKSFQCKNRAINNGGNNGNSSQRF